MTGPLALALLLSIQQAAPPPPARVAPTFETLHLTAVEMPSTEMKLGGELNATSPLVKSLAESGTIEGLAAPAARHDFQTITAPSGGGSIVYLDFGAAMSGATLKTIQKAVWGEKEKPTREHPEWIVRAGDGVVLLSFPLSSRVGRFAGQRLRSKFGLRVPVDDEDARKVLEPLVKAYRNHDAAVGIFEFEGHADKYAKYAYAGFLEGEFRSGKKQWEAADAAYARALRLDLAADPLPDDATMWQLLENRGEALYHQKKYDDAEKALDWAIVLAASIGDDKGQAQSLYNLACTLALSGKKETVVARLAECFKLDPSMVETARNDEDFVSMKDDPAFQKLLPKLEPEPAGTDDDK